MSRARPTETAEPSPALLERARGGDREALETLLRRIHPLVHRWSLVRTGDAAEADDLAQEVLVRVVRQLGSFRGDARFTSWLYRVVGNAAIDRARRRRRRRERTEEWEMLQEAGRAGASERSGTDEPGRPGQVEEGPADRIDRARLLERVRQCYLGLTERQRQVFDLCELEGLPSTEVGERLDIAPATVRVTLLKARRAVREEILRTDPELVEAFLS